MVAPRVHFAVAEPALVKKPLLRRRTQSGYPNRVESYDGLWQVCGIGNPRIRPYLAVMATAVWTTTAAPERAGVPQKGKKSKPASPGTFLITLVTHQGRAVFAISRVAERLIDTLLTLRTRGNFKLHAFVVLPDRVHVLLTPQARELTTAVHEIEAEFAQHLDTVRRVWESGFESHPVRSLRDLERLRTHLHDLPVRARVAEAAEMYPYSSAFRLR